MQDYLMGVRRKYKQGLREKKVSEGSEQVSEIIVFSPKQSIGDR